MFRGLQLLTVPMAVLHKDLWALCTVHEVVIILHKKRPPEFKTEVESSLNLY